MRNIEDYEAMSKLELSESERRWVREMSDQFHFDALENIDVSGVEPLITVLGIKNVLREDKSVKMLTREELLSNAPEQYDGCFQVPKTLD